MIKKLDGDVYSSSQENDEVKKSKNSNSQLLEVKHCANDAISKKPSDSTKILCNIAKQSYANEKKFKKVNEYLSNANNQFNKHPIHNNTIGISTGQDVKHDKEAKSPRPTMHCDTCDMKKPLCNCSTKANEILANKMTKANKYFYNGTSNMIDRIRTPEYRVHATELLQFLLSLWKEKKLCDLQFKIDGRVYAAHRLALAMFSRKYRDVFQKASTTPDEQPHYSSTSSTSSTIVLKNTTDVALNAILNYIYTAEIDINPANADEILNGAKELGVENLICMSQDYLDSLSIGDVLTFMINLFDKDGSGLVIYEIYVYMMTHLTKITRTPEYLKASISTIKSFLADSNLSVKNEVEIFDAAMRWINYDKTNRERHTPELIAKCVRFTLLSPQDLHAKTQTCPILNENKELSQAVLNAFKYYSFRSCNDTTFRNLVKREESRSLNLKGSSVPECFVLALKELAQIACKLKAERTHATTNVAKFIESFDDDTNGAAHDHHRHHQKQNTSCACKRHLKSTSIACCYNQTSATTNGIHRSYGADGALAMNKERVHICTSFFADNCCNSDGMMGKSQHDTRHHQTNNNSQDHEHEHYSAMIRNAPNNKHQTGVSIVSRSTSSTTSIKSFA